MKHATAALMFCLASLSANAQAVYRCGSEYSQTPCPQGRLVDTTDLRTDAQRAEARRVVADQQRLAADMRRERLAEQAAYRPAGAISLSGLVARPADVAIDSQKAPKKKRASTQPAKATDVILVQLGSTKRRGRE